MNIVCFGAHPDDAEVFAGGTLVKCAQAGHDVLLVAITNGDAGHHAMKGAALAARRAAEAEASARIGGLKAQVLPNHDGRLQPSLDVREQIVRIIREHKADVVLSHRPWDYHPDHRYAAMAVQDAAYMVMVPNFCPDVGALRHNPIFLYMMDRFTKPVPFTPDIAVAVDDVMETKWAMFDAMDSQFYEWLPWIEGRLDAVPTDGEARRAWLREAWTPFYTAFTRTHREALINRYGPDAEGLQFAEFFELCEYGRCPDTAELAELLPR